ncbi:MAG: YdeI/OmpD-associated family protein [Candidatus Bathyarchaeota archaeon]|nr:YdeI/OmpD-associated family protein [Candidatus Bathyarchaeota archaeon]
MKEALKENQQAWSNFQAFTNSEKLMYIHWIQTAKRPQTRKRRVNEVTRRAAENIKPG